MEYLDVRVRVYQDGRSLADNYVECMTVVYLAEGCRSLGIQWERDTESGPGAFPRFFFLLQGEEEVMACSADVSRLLQYVTEQTEFFQTQRGVLYFRCQAEGLEFDGRVPFGKMGIYDDLERDYWLEPELVRAHMAGEYESGLEQARKRKEYEDLVAASGKEQEKTDGEEAGGGPVGGDPAGGGPESGGPESGDPEGGDTGDGDGKDPDDGSGSGDGEPVFQDPLEEPARLIYEVLPEGENYTFEVCYNAKGNFYIDLGSRPAGQEKDAYTEGSYRFTLVYDRPSKNDKCELFVFYKEHYAPKEGSGDSAGTGYNDSTAILEFYAVEKETGNVIAAGKTAWDQVGCESYREATGE